MPSCSAYNCTYKPDRNFVKGKSVHLFPFSRPDICLQWIRNVRRKDWQPNKSSLLCSDHFEENCFLKTKLRIKLKKDAVPTIFNFSPKSKEKTIKKRPSRRKIVNPVTEASTSVDPVPEISTTGEPVSVLQASTASVPVVALKPTASGVPLLVFKKSTSSEPVPATEASPIGETIPASTTPIPGELDAAPTTPNTEQLVPVPEFEASITDGPVLVPASEVSLAGDPVPVPYFEASIIEDPVSVPKSKTSTGRKSVPVTDALSTSRHETLEQVPVPVSKSLNSIDSDDHNPETVSTTAKKRGRKRKRKNQRKEVNEYENLKEFEDNLRWLISIEEEEKKLQKVKKKS